jgi:hypothetical protein
LTQNFITLAQSNVTGKGLSPTTFELSINNKKIKHEINNINSQPGRSKCKMQ